jgi:hypothetical protein
MLVSTYRILFSCFTLFSTFDLTNAFVLCPILHVILHCPLLLAPSDYSISVLLVVARRFKYSLYVQLTVKDLEGSSLIGRLKI